MPFADARRSSSRARRDARRASPRSTVTRYWERKLGARRHSPARSARSVRRHAADRDRAHPGEPRRPGAPARPASLHAFVDPRRRDDVGGAAAHGLRGRGARLPRWYAPYQAADGNVPCAVDRNGADWLPEHDSHGQLVFTLAEYFRFTGDRAFAARAVARRARAVALSEALRAQRARPEFREPETARALRHPAGVGQPRGLPRAAGARLLGRLLGAARARRRGGAGARARRRGRRRGGSRALRDALRECLYESIDDDDRRARRSTYVPGSVEWADFDPTATADRDRHDRRGRSDCRPPCSRRTFDEYLRDSAGGAAARSTGTTTPPTRSASSARWCGSAAATTRTSCSTFFLADRRPLAWNQWPEISWRDPRSPGHLGDVPHAWIGAEFVLAVLGAVRVRAPGRRRAGARGRHLRRRGSTTGEVGIDDLPTWWGPLGYTCGAPDGAIELDLAPGLRPPPGGIVICPPLPRPLAAVEVDGRPIAAFDAESATLRESPAHVVMRF